MLFAGSVLLMFSWFGSQKWFSLVVDVSTFSAVSFTLNQLVTTGVLTWYVLLFVLVPTISLLLLTRFEETQSQQCVNLSSSLKYAKQMLLQHAFQNCASWHFSGTQLRAVWPNGSVPEKCFGHCYMSGIVGLIGPYLLTLRPCGLMDKAPDFESGDCRFESCHGRLSCFKNTYICMNNSDRCSLYM